MTTSVLPLCYLGEHRESQIKLPIFVYSILTAQGGLLFWCAYVCFITVVTNPVFYMYPPPPTSPPSQYH